MSKSNKSDKKLTTPSVLAFERKLDPSDALFAAGAWADQNKAESWQPVAVREKSVRGTISNRLKTKDQDPAKLDAAIENPNPQTVDVATLPPEADTLRVSFSLRVLPGTGEPTACNNIEYRNKLITTVQNYIEQHGMTELARRYAHNLANGRFLWRNRVGAEAITIHIAHQSEGQDKKIWTFDALALNLRDFAANTQATSNLQELSNLIAQGLTGSSHVLLHITAYVRIGAGQEVYPSQELILEKTRGEKSKTLYTVEQTTNKGVNKIAAIHSQKIGNALRTIDTWHPDVAELGPIAVEPYGSVTTLGKACRKPTDKLDFYNLLDNWLLKDQAPATEQQHFVIATLIRGGVFGDAG